MSRLKTYFAIGGLCLHEVNLLAKLDREKKLRFTDIESVTYNADLPQNGRVSYSDAMKKIHAVCSTGEVLRGVEVFRRAYGAVGLGWIYAFTNIPYISGFVENIYDFWAKYRTLITRGEKLENLISSSKNVNCDCTPDKLK